MRIRLLQCAGIALITAACGSVTALSETPLVGTTLYYGIYYTGVPLLQPEVLASSGAFRLRHTFIYPDAGYALSAWLSRRGSDTLIVEVRARQQSGPSPQLVWRHDYEYLSENHSAGNYVLRWSEVRFDLRLRSNDPLRFDTLRTDTHVLDTIITIPP